MGLICLHSANILAMHGATNVKNWVHHCEAHSCNRCSCGQATNITYSECVSLALVIQNAMQTPHYIFTCVLQYFSTLSHKRCLFRIKVIAHKTCVLILSTNVAWNISQSKERWRDVIQNVHRSPCEVPVILVIFWWNCYFLDGSSGKYSDINDNASNGHRVYSTWTEGRMETERERQIDMT